jgi:membrane protease YdiL (CAAX protease family)
MILVLLLVSSWIILYAIERRSVFAQWLTPVSHRVFQFFQGVFIALVVYMLQTGISTFFRSIDWMHNVTTSAQTYQNHLVNTAQTALIEELLFRGVLLFFLIKYIGIRWGIAISAFAYAFYGTYGFPEVTFSYIINFIPSFLFGIVLAYATTKTNSIILSFGLNFCWMFLQPMFGSLLFVEISSIEVTDNFLLEPILTRTIPYLLFYLFIRYFVEKEKPVVYLQV